MVGQPLRRQHLGQVALLAAALLQLGPLVQQKKSAELDAPMVTPRY